MMGHICSCPCSKPIEVTSERHRSIQSIHFRHGINNRPHRTYSIIMIEVDQRGNVIYGNIIGEVKIIIGDPL